MQDLVRQEVFQSCRTVIVKIGTNVLTTDNDRLDLNRIQCIADQIFRIQQTGRKVVLVSSGAVGAGIGILGLNRRPDSLPSSMARTSPPGKIPTSSPVLRSSDTQDRPPPPSR